MRYKKKKVMKVMTMVMLFLTLMSAAVCNPVSVEASDTAEKTVTARIPVVCEKVDSEETFRYQLKGSPSQYEEIEQTELELKGGEKGYFQISYHYPGTYYYTVSQIAGTDKKTTYDNTEYQVDVYVTESENGELFAQPILYLKGEDEKKAELAFKNTRETEKGSSNTPNTAKGKTDTRHKVKTGDTTDIVWWSVFLVISGMVLITATLQKNRMRREEKEHE
ncbi:MAG: FctA domain-containing protein [Ruminococcus sp.]|nr:FctA domain-containing protein [Ruminococcus sp.]